jgi:hypothetical protein
LDTLKIKNKQEEENATMSIYCPRYRRKNSSRECPLDNVGSKPKWKEGQSWGKKVCRN